MFSPPLYKQRHDFVIQFVKDHKPKKVVDLGCGDLKLLRKLRFHREIQLLAGVDTNSSVITKKKHSLSPLPTEYLQPPVHPLTVELYHGSVTKREPRIKGYDLATCIELVEHLHPAEVEKFAEVLFGYMAPSAAVISTPNADYNPLLPGCSGFRHLDHKFEWTQAEFCSWALEICRSYGYRVEFTGVGRHPSDEESVGFCSQIGVFYKDTSRCSMLLRNEAYEDVPVYSLLYKVEYPSLCDNNILHRTLMNEVLYAVECVRRQWLEALQKEIGDVQSSDDSASRVSEDDGQEPYWLGGDLCVPLARVFSFPKVRELSGNMQRLRGILLDDSRVRLIGDVMVSPASEEELTDTCEGGACRDYGPAEHVSL
ncbi:small RNA 2'-O-methyltransferase [Scleropages formosus]|uniref:Small RNA 2'-O-methyltransferase n=1 Tax=Scleropages formosus TaxID=113540 RepID=A0A8D0CCU4_SCLFO|nr:small RNA 2'-O-methyltransferase [Scleropages formosus]